VVLWQGNCHERQLNLSMWIVMRVTHRHRDQPADRPTVRFSAIGVPDTDGIKPLSVLALVPPVAGSCVSLGV
jgi:hypothetical protein